MRRCCKHLRRSSLVEIADIVVLMCNKLSEKEQEVIYKIIKHHKAVCKERMEGTKNNHVNRETLLYVVHNYKMLTEIEQVQAQIQRDLTNSFEIDINFSLHLS